MNSIPRIFGIDQSKRTMEVCILNEHDSKIERKKYSTNDDGLKQFIATLKPIDTVALETGNNAFHIAKLIMSQVDCTVHVLNAGKLHMIFRSLKKTDKEDALKIATFVKRHPVEELPLVTVPEDEIMAMRSIAHQQCNLKDNRTAKINELHNLFWNNGLSDIKKNGLKKAAARNAAIEKLDTAYQRSAQRMCTIIDILEEQIQDIESEMQEMLQKKSEEITISMSMPGIGFVSAFVIAAYLEKMQNFASARQVGFYAGFTPRVDCSGDTNRYGHITKNGPSLLRRALVQAAWAAMRSTEGERFKLMYERIKARRGTKRAIVAVARKMLEILFVMHTRGELYDGCVDHTKLIKKLQLYKIIPKAA